MEIKCLNEGYVRLIDSMGDDNTPLEAARMSTGKETGLDEAKDDALRDYLMRHRHHTPFEMCELHLEVQAPIFVARQWMRHRVPFSYNEHSGRYAEMPELFYVPAHERIRAQDAHNKQGSGKQVEDPHHFMEEVSFANEVANERYQVALNQGVARELARVVLPLSQYTRFRVKANLRGWFNFIELRATPHAQEEIRVYAEAIAQIIKSLWPKCYAVFDEHTLGAVTFSRAEMEILKGAVWQNTMSAEAFIRWASESRLSPGRRREFLEGLGLSAPSSPESQSASL